MANPRPSQGSKHYPELVATLKSIKSYFIYAGVFSAAVNLLMLVPVIYLYAAGV